MMSIHCPRHGHEVLVGHRQILGIEGRGAEMTVRWVCWCGHEGTTRPHGGRTFSGASAPIASAA
jgi:hypothetical protein